MLVLVVPGGEGSAAVVLIERATGGAPSLGRGQLPRRTGRRRATPISIATAVREAEEEIGLDVEAAEVRVAGIAEPFWIPVSNFSVTPVVAVAARRPVLAASPSEVARIVEAPLSAFVPPAPIEIVERDVGEWRIRYGGYRIGDLHVWGATARILGQLGAFLG